MVVFKLRTSLSVRKYNGLFNLSCSGQNDLYISDICQDIYETADTGVSDERGRRKTAELHTSGAKRGETLRWGVK